jgi:3-deoxy-D-manno-octulosonate 8-phosphate phosphatase KdsC-like HAD superfamily phosphatase
VAYIGDDFTNVPIMRRVGFAVATANARPEVQGRRALRDPRAGRRRRRAGSD